MPDCIFCQIAAGQAPAEKVYEDETILAFKDLKPSAPIHLLIIPKQHLASIQATSEQERELLGKLILTAKNLAAERKLTGYKLIFNVGKDGGQIIFHLHLHLLGGLKNGLEAKTVRL